MSIPGPNAGGERTAPLFARAGSLLLYAALLWPPLAAGAHEGWPLALTQLLVLGALGAWALEMLAARRLDWRPTALDLPLALLAALVLVQLALGPGAFGAWALAPPPRELAVPASLPAPPIWVGTVSRPQTADSLLLFLTYAAVYVLVVNLVRRRAELDRLVRTLLLAGGALAFLALIDYLSRESWLLFWRPGPSDARLGGTFANPDHFGAWLGMLTCLGIGYLAARRGPGEGAAPLAALTASRTEREAAIRGWLPLAGVALTSLALVFTLSRGALLSLLVALGALLLVRGRLDPGRGWLALTGVALGLALGYGIWIGLDPLLARISGAGHVKRWVQWMSTLPMLADFPLLGVGLGAYKDIYFRYQPGALEAGRVYFPYAHSDVLQWLVETGPLGGALAVWAGWRVGRDLVGAHVLGRGRCPAGGGRGEDARRHDTWSLGVALGALAAVLALLIHSLLDFSARIPAVGILGAACLAMATVALHTRFGASEGRELVPTRSRAVGGGPWRAAAVLALLALISIPILAPALAESRLAPGAGLAAADAAVRVNPLSVRALRTRADLRINTARALWRGGAADAPAGDAQRARAGALVAGAIEDLRRALVLRPTEPFLHEHLGVAYATAAAMDGAEAAGLRASAFTHLARAVALAPSNPLLYRTLAVIAASGREPRIDLALSAARETVRLDRALLSDVVDRLLPLGLGAEQWMAAVPDSPADRLRLAALLEGRGLLDQAGAIYGRAAAGTGPLEPLARWARARLLLRARHAAAALDETEAALKLDPDNPELQLARAEALATLGRGAALDAFERALRSSEALAQSRGAGPFERAAVPAGLSALVADRLGGGARPGPARYRRALARYLVDQKLWSQARLEWEAVLAEAPQDALGHFSLGLALDASGAGDRAIEEYRRAVALDGRSARFRGRLAQRLWDTEQFVQAIGEWQAATALEPRNLAVALALARAYVRVGDSDRASREYERILSVAPGHAEARQALGRLRRTQ